MSVRLSKKNNIANMIVTKPLSVFAASCVSALVVEGEVAKQNVEIFGFKLPLYLIYGVLGATSSLITNPITDTVML